MATTWLLLNLLSIIILAFYSMLEMACVSFNKVRLQYYVNKGSKRAEWLNYLLHSPSRLFGTTLLGVNVAMFVGSECAREFHIAVGLDPNLAPLTQVFIVIIFGELAPMFAARHYPEHVAMLGAPIVYFSAKLMAPIVWVLGKISSFSLYLFGDKDADSNMYLSQEELIKILEDIDEDHHSEGDPEDINAIASNIFRLRDRTVEQIMTPLSIIPMLPSNATIIQMKNMLRRTEVEYLPIYHQRYSNIVGIAQPRDLLRITDTKRVRNFARPPWFITEAISLHEILKQFRVNRESVAVILNDLGAAIGIVTLDSALQEVFGKGDKEIELDDSHSVFLDDRTFSGTLTVKDFNDEFGVDLGFDIDLTLSEMVIEVLGHPPKVGDQVKIANFEINVKEVTLLTVKSLSISSKVR
jgi:magnesium and cobalt exporter, CNNM family